MTEGLLVMSLIFLWLFMGLIGFILASIFESTPSPRANDPLIILGPMGFIIGFGYLMLYILSRIEAPRIFRRTIEKARERLHP